MQKPIDTIAALVLDTQKRFPHGTNKEDLFIQMRTYNEKIALLTGKLMMSSMLDNESIKDKVAQLHAEHPGWHYLGLGDAAEFADAPDEASAAAAGVAGIHFDAQS